MDEFSIQHEQRGKVTVISVAGRVDSATAPTMDAELDKLIPANKKVVLDLKEVNFLSSAGVRAIVKALKTAKKSKHQIRLAAIPAHIAELMETMGLMELMKAYPSLEEAMANF